MTPGGTAEQPCGMAVTLERVIEIDRPIEDVWRFLTDPGRIMWCIPGASLLKILDERTFLGEIAVRIGPFGTILRGQARFEVMDSDAYAVEMAAEARELGGDGSAHMRLSSRLTRAEEARTLVELEQVIRLSGRLAMIAASGLLTQAAEFMAGRFAACLQSCLEAGAAATGPRAVADPGTATGGRE